MTKTIVHVLRTGRMGYAKSLQLQQSLANQERTQFRNTIILTEHNPVYTIGIRAKDYNQDRERLQQLGAEFCQTNRGGLITFHGPGQLVAYPILNLKDFTPSVRWYVCHIEKTIIDLCKKYNLNAATTSQTGVWIDDRKICAIGIHASRYITTHGLAMNCDTDLRWFDHIVPCGIEGKGVTSLTKELSEVITIEHCATRFLQSFEKVFDCNVRDV